MTGSTNHTPRQGKVRRHVLQKVQPDGSIVLWFRLVNVDNELGTLVVAARRQNQGGIIGEIGGGTCWAHSRRQCIDVLPVELLGVELERRQVDLRPVRSKRLRSDNHTLGYVRITQFAEPVPEQMAQALKDLDAKQVEGLILDLRNNSGGLVNAGLAVADQLLAGGPIVETRGRDGLGSPVMANPASLYSGPMLTLVNGGTASASEILAGALQDDGRSPLLGSQTFGKGLIQSLIPLGDGSGLAVTVARYVTPSGRDIQNQGITPDEALDGPEPLNPGGDDDAWLAQAQRLLVQQLEADSAPAAQP